MKGSKRRREQALKHFREQIIFPQHYHGKDYGFLEPRIEVHGDLTTVVVPVHPWADQEEIERLAKFYFSEFTYRIEVV